MREDNHIFPKTGSKLFLGGGLDTRLSIEIAQQFRFFVKRFSPVGRQEIVSFFERFVFEEESVCLTRGCCVRKSLRAE